MRRSRAGLLAATAGVIAALLAAIVLTALSWGERGQENARWVRHTLDADRQLVELLSSLQDAETGQRGYLLTGREYYLAPYERARDRALAALDRIGQQLADNPGQQTRLDRLRPVVMGKLDELAETVALTRDGQAVAALQIVMTDRGRELMQAARAIVAGMRGEEARLLEERQVSMDRTTEGLRFILIAASLGVLVLAGLAALGARQAIAELRAARDLTLAEMASRQAAESQLRQAQKMEAVGQLTGGIAHDFNNILAVILGGLDLAKRRLAPGQDQAAKFIDSSIEAAERAARLTAQLLAYSRQQALMPTAVAPNRLIISASEMLQRTLPESIELQTVLAAGLWSVHVDAHQVENALINLCLNARDAMPDGGKLTIETSNAFIDEAYAKAHELAVGQYVLLAVTDTGHGMSPETIARAFDPFFTTKEVGKGTGLGLSQILGFVKQSSGHVKIYSEPGQGTTVKIYLPRHVGAEGAAPSGVPSPIQHGRPDEIVLLVEDDDRMRAVNVDLLRELGYGVIHAARPQVALAALEANPRVTLLFTDVVMPEMNGRQLAEEARRQHPGLKVLYTTGYTRNAIVHNGVVDADARLLTKPFTLEQLSAAVRTAIDA
jgi:signal transduction histidine kinase/CheY-like chemotaxis protein